jgi:transcriptional regulator with XRE-family HTH domain
MRHYYGARRHDLHARAITLISTTRETLGWTQRQLARRSGLSASTISRLESGRLTDMTLRTVGRLLDALGIRVEVLAGSAHGWIDLLAFHPRTRSLLVIEIKTEIRDVGTIQRSMAWYEREAFAAARRLTWRPVRLASALLLLETDANDVAVNANRQLFQQSFPIRAGTPATWLADSAGHTPGRGLAMIDPTSHRQAWLRASRADGRRSAARFLNYADFMRRSRIRGRRPEARD